MAELPPPAKVIALYPGVAPGSENWTWAEREGVIWNMPMAENVVRPVLLFYPADKAKAVGTAMIVAPGGGFRNLWMGKEGADVAMRLNTMGVDAFVLKYRLRYTEADWRKTRGPGPAAAIEPTGPQAGQNVVALAGADGQQAMRLLRREAASYGVKPDRVGIIGFSAGGTVAIWTARGALDGRPDFAAAIYPGGASGDAPPVGAPRLFIAVAADDQAVGYQGSLDLFSAWRKANIPAELHIFQTGGHGFGIKGGGADHFMERVEEWMRVNGDLGK